MSDFDDLDAFRDSEPEPGETATPAPELIYGSTDEFVREKLIHIYARKVGPQNDGVFRWAADWWRYPEAVSRLESLWRAWESLRLDGATGMSSWWRDHADHHMPMLMSVDGPFAFATSRNSPGDPLPYEPPPDGYFPDVRPSRDYVRSLSE